MLARIRAGDWRFIAAASGPPVMLVALLRIPGAILPGMFGEVPTVR
jgi:hypothetical protein